MTAHRAATSVAAIFTIVLAAGCGNQPASVLLPERIAEPTQALRLGDDLGPTICFSSAILNYCYPGPGYFVGPEAEVPVTVRAGAPVSMSWSAQPSPGRSIRSYRWSLDIEDVTDQTPRIDEATDLKHWSVPSATPQTVTLGPWSDGELHKLFVEVEDSMGWKSLGIVRFTAQAGVNQPPDCSGAHAEASTWPLDGTFAPVSIAGVIDPDGDQVTITVTGVTQDEPVQGPGHGDSCPDAVIESGSASVRLERLGSGNGRVYTVSFTASDGFGGTCTRSVDVCVPHDRRPGGSCIKDASAFNSLGPCSEGDGEPQLVRRR